MANEPALKLERVSYHYPNNWVGRSRRGLSDVSVTIHRAESFGFLGPNGAGKTTSIKCILGLVPIASGEISILGIPHTDSDSRRLIGYLPEQPYFYDYLTVFECVELYAALAGVPRRQRKHASEAAIERVGLTDRYKTRMRSLSKGLTQRVALAQAIVAEPRILILDEPFSGLDPIGRREFREIFSAFKASGTTIFLSSHILADVEFLCDRVSVMTNGTLQGVFDVDTICQRAEGSFEIVSGVTALPSHIDRSSYNVQDFGRFLRWTFRERQVAERMLVHLVASGVYIEHFGFNRGGLEDFFISLVNNRCEQAQQRATHCRNESDGLGLSLS